MKKRGLSNNLVFYNLSFSHHSSIENWYHNILVWFENYNQTPTRVGITAPFIKSTQTMSFKNGHKKLLENGFEGVDSISLYANVPNHNIDMSDFNFCAYVRLKENRTNLILSFDNDIITFSRSCLEELIQQQSQYFTPGYGICYQRDYKFGPIFYAIGMIQGDLSKEEEENIAEWFREYGDPETYYVGLLRDIYPLNILSQPHLDQQVHGQSLKDWICSSPDHGDLKQLTPEVWSWWVEADQIPSVRQALAPSGIILCV